MMSAAGDVVANVSRVAQLLETIDTACRLTCQLQEQGSALNTDHSLEHLSRLERTIEDGRSSIQEADGRGQQALWS